MTRATFMLTDVAGSTSLWEEDPEATAAALARHDALVAEAVGGAGGTVVWDRGEGDSRFAVFASAAAAAEAAAALARAVAAEAWPTPRPLQLRMALHTGNGDRYGPDVNRAARLRGAAWPGQVLVSAAAGAALEGASLVELGWHALGAGVAPERVFQLVAEGLEGDFPALPTARHRHNLPEQATSFVGRELEVAEVSKVLAHYRLVTVVGVGGAGKTRLGLEVAAAVAEDYRHGAWLVELAPVGDPALLPQAVATALGVREEAGRDLVRTMVEWLGPRELVLVLDNCEHVLSAAATLAARLLRFAAGLRILATSREPLGVAGELCWAIPPLETVDPTRVRDPEALAYFDATSLFWDRACSADPSLVLDDANAGAAARICARLDGLPLAIELAAAQAALLRLPELDRGLEDRLTLLGSGAACGAAGRQRTLGAAIDWSHDLLDPPERTLFRRLAAFAGSFSLEAAETVCADPGLAADSVLDLLVALVTKSLVAVEDHGRTTRYRQLETIRAYASERLAAAGETDEIGRRHLNWALDVADEAHPKLDGPEVGQTLDDLEDEHDNFRRALGWAIEFQYADEALRLVADLVGWWATRGHWREGRSWADQALGIAGDQPSALRARALLARGELMLAMDDRRAAPPSFEEALVIFRHLDDAVGVADALTGLSASHQQLPNGEPVQGLQEAALAAWEAAGTTRGYCNSISTVFHNLGQLAWPAGDRARARWWFDKAVDEARRHGDVAALVAHLCQLGLVEDQDGNYARAKALEREAFPIATRLGASNWTGAIVRNLAMVAIHEGNATEAASYIGDGLSRLIETGSITLVSNFIEVMGWTATLAGAHTEAARVLGMSERRREHYNGTTAIHLASIQREHDAVVAKLRAALGDEALARAWSQGKATSLDEAVEVTLALAERLAAAELERAA